MKLWMQFILLSVFVSGLALRVSAQDTRDATPQSIQDLRAQLNDLQDREAELKIRLDQLNFDLKPENIERYFNGYGSLHPEELREHRRKQLETEKNRVLAQLDQFASSRVRLEADISVAQARAYQQVAPAAAILQRDPTRGNRLWTAIRLLVTGLVLVLVLGSLGFRVFIRQQRNI